MDDFIILLPQRSIWNLGKVILYTTYPHCYRVIPNHLPTLFPTILHCCVLWSLIFATLYDLLSFGIPLHSPQASFLSALAISVWPQEFPFSCQQLLRRYLLFLQTLSTLLKSKASISMTTFLARRQVNILFPSCHILSHQCFNAINQLSLFFKLFI